MIQNLALPMITYLTITSENPLQCHDPPPNCHFSVASLHGDIKDTIGNIVREVVEDTRN